MFSLEQLPETVRLDVDVHMVAPLRQNVQRHAHLSRMPLVELAGVLEFPERASQGPENDEERFWRLFPRAYHAQPTFPIARALDFRPP